MCYFCHDCSHVQQLDILDSSTLWQDYSYFSGQAKGMKAHFEAFSSEVLKRHSFNFPSLVVDIGSNDGSLLNCFKQQGFMVQGVDPASNVAKYANDQGIPTIVDKFNGEVAETIKREKGKAAIITAFNAYAHADDLQDMTLAIKQLLSDDGVFYFEVQYLQDVIDKVLIGSIFHEHMSHHSFIPLQKFLQQYDLEIFSVEHADIQQGSLIGAVQHKGGKRAIDDSVTALYQQELNRGLNTFSAIAGLQNKILNLRELASTMFSELKSKNKTIAAFGAARSGQTLISQLAIDGYIEYIVDDHPQKLNKFPAGDGIPVIPTAELLTRMPDYTVILAWVHSERIIANNQAYLDNGGKFIVLTPDLQIYEK